MKATDITTATADQQADIIRAYWLERNPPPDPERLWVENWDLKAGAFERMLACGAYLSAVELMLPPRANGWSLNVDKGICQTHIFRDGDGVIGRGDHSIPALALLAAIAQVEEQDEDR